MNQHTIFLLLFTIAGGSTVIKIISDWQRHQRDRKDLETQRMQSEIKFLKSQINPHFLFNTLNSLYALTLKKSDKAPEIVIKLSEMMRYMLYESNERRVPLQKEVNYIQNYLALSLRQSGHADIQFKVEGQITDQTIAPLIFIPFLENSFKHGLNHQISEGYVHVTMKVLDNKLLLRILNESGSIATAFRKTSGGIGLASTTTSWLSLPSNTK
jgi:LytS/YehU family sensor histidine kinase